MEIPDDILLQFEKDAAENYAWDDTAHKCDECGVVFATGDVMIIHGDLAVAIAQIKHRCVECGYQHIVEAAKAPSGMGVHVERRYKRRLLSELPPGLADRIRDALETIANVEKTMKELFERQARAKEEGTDGKPE